jgi:hypothetical protein
LIASWLLAAWPQLSAHSPSAGPTIDKKDEENHAMKNTLKTMRAVVIVPFSFVGGVVAYLVYPGTPGRSRFMSFDGYIELPRGGLLNVLDYLTLSGSTLFVTSESSGSLFKIDLDPNHPSVSSVSEMPGAGAAHGIALLPEANIAFITRSEGNKVDVFDPKSLQQLQSIPVADDADAILFVPSAKLMYIANGDAKLATLIDPVKRVTVGRYTSPGKPRVSRTGPAVRTALSKIL